MNHREPPHLSAGSRRALHCLSLLLLPALGSHGAHALPRPPRPDAGEERSTDTTPYLRVTGAPPLRFQEAQPPPDLVTRPAAAAPPVPALSPTESSVAQANAAAARSAAIAEAAPATAPAAADATEKPVAPTTPAKVPPSIIPDTARPSVRPEDFLPYFQIPGAAQSSGDVTLFVPGAKAPPAPPPLPASSATYRQTK